MMPGQTILIDWPQPASKKLGDAGTEMFWDLSPRHMERPKAAVSHHLCIAAKPREAAGEVPIADTTTRGRGPPCQQRIRRDFAIPMSSRSSNPS